MPSISSEQAVVEALIQRLKTNDDTTLELLHYTRSIRKALNDSGWHNSAIRKLTLGETQFDIAPGNSQLSFADFVLITEIVLQL